MSWLDDFECERAQPRQVSKEEGQRREKLRLQLLDCDNKYGNEIKQILFDVVSRYVGEKKLLLTYQFYSEPTREIDIDPDEGKYKLTWATEFTVSKGLFSERHKRRVQIHYNSNSAKPNFIMTYHVYIDPDRVQRAWNQGRLYGYEVEQYRGDKGWNWALGLGSKFCDTIEEVRDSIKHAIAAGFFSPDKVFHSFTY